MNSQPTVVATVVIMNSQPTVVAQVCCMCVGWDKLWELHLAQLLKLCEVWRRLNLSIFTNQANIVSS